MKNLVITVSTARHSKRHPSPASGQLKSKRHRPGYGRTADHRIRPDHPRRHVAEHEVEDDDERPEKAWTWKRGLGEAAKLGVRLLLTG